MAAELCEAAARGLVERTTIAMTGIAARWRRGANEGLMQKKMTLTQHRKPLDKAQFDAHALLPPESYTLSLRDVNSKESV